MRGPPPLTPGVRELIAACSPWLNACGFCTGTHLLAAPVFGVDEENF